MIELLLLAVVFFVAPAVAVVAYATYTDRGLPLPGSPVVDERVNRWSSTVTEKVGGPLENTAVSGALITHGVVLSPEKDHSFRQRFLQAERAILGLLPGFARRRIEPHLPASVRLSGPAALTPMTSEASSPLL